jgi:hypothetical protein
MGAGGLNGAIQGINGSNAVGYHSNNTSAATTASTTNANRTANGLTKSLGEDSVQRILKKTNPKAIGKSSSG